MPKKKSLSALALISVLLTLPAVFGSTFSADITPPTTSSVIEPSAPDGNNGWYVSPVNIVLTATDLDSGVSRINYRVDGGLWVTSSFDNTLNLAPNPSFEEYDASSSISAAGWEKTTSDAGTTYLRDGGVSAPDYPTNSVRITSSTTGWHGINHALSFVPAVPYNSMSASAMIKTESLAGTAYFKIYSVSLDAGGLPVYTFLSQSSALAGSINWTLVTHSFVVNDPNSIGVYMDIGMDDAGITRLDAVTITDSSTLQQINTTVGWDGRHTFEYYSVDRAGNIETYDCAINKNCIKFDIDQTPPGNWHDSSAIRGLGSDHELWVQTTVEDETSGLSNNTDEYMYHTDMAPGFGRFTDLSMCNSVWQADVWTSLLETIFLEGDLSGQLKTQKTEFCDNDWKTCKTVRFYAEDMAGNSSTQDFCINGPWLKFRGNGIVRSNSYIKMISEPEEYNTDSIIETGGSEITFFTSTQNWKAKSTAAPLIYSYDDMMSLARSAPTSVTALTTVSGVYQINGDFEITSKGIPNTFDDNTFNQVYFINGNLRVTDNIEVATTSTALFIVKGNVEIDKAVDTLGIAILCDGSFYTAYDISEGEGAITLELNGVYSANKFVFQRTLQGTNNTKYPSESFIYEPKYVTNLRDYLGSNSIIWVSTN